MDQIRRVHPGLRKGLDCKLVLGTGVSFGQGVDIMIEHDWTWGFMGKVIIQISWIFRILGQTHLSTGVRW